MANYIGEDIGNAVKNFLTPDSSVAQYLPNAPAAGNADALLNYTPLLDPMGTTNADGSTTPWLNREASGAKSAAGSAIADIWNGFTGDDLIAPDVNWWLVGGVGAAFILAAAYMFSPKIKVIVPRT